MSCSVTIWMTPWERTSQGDPPEVLPTPGVIRVPVDLLAQEYTKAKHLMQLHMKLIYIRFNLHPMTKGGLTGRHVFFKSIIPP